MPDPHALNATKSLADLIVPLAPVIGVVSVVIGAIVNGLFQALVSRLQVKHAHEGQLELLMTTHRQNLHVLQQQIQREETLRERQYAESDKADRLLILEYVDLLLPRLLQICTIDYLSSDNKDEEQLRQYLNTKKYITANSLDPAHPEKTLGLRVAFLLFQFIGAMRIALNARWNRPLTEAQSRFLATWEEHFEPIICSGRYPGKELFYREQVEIVASEILLPSDGLTRRPLNWKEFCEHYEQDAVLKALADNVVEKLQFIFVETNSLPPRKAMQCRLAIMSLYLIDLSKLTGSNLWNPHENDLWDIVGNWFELETSWQQNPQWFIFERGDVAVRSGKGTRPVPSTAARPDCSTDYSGPNIIDPLAISKIKP